MKRILLVEDENVIRMVLKIMLEEKGHKVDEVENGQEAIALNAENDFDLILMDLHMPVMSGFKAIRKLRENGYQKYAIAITASMTKEDHSNAVSAGFDDCVLKNFEDEFYQVIEKYL